MPGIRKRLTKAPIARPPYQVLPKPQFMLINYQHGGFLANHVMLGKSIIVKNKNVKR